MGPPRGVSPEAQCLGFDLGAMDGWMRPFLFLLRALFCFCPMDGSPTILLLPRSSSVVFKMWSYGLLCALSLCMTACTRGVLSLTPDITGQG